MAAIPTCPRCIGGQIVRTYPDEPPSCFQCGYEPLTGAQREFIDHELDRADPHPSRREPRLSITAPKSIEERRAQVRRARMRRRAGQ